MAPVFQIGSCASFPFFITFKAAVVLNGYGYLLVFLVHGGNTSQEIGVFGAEILGSVLKGKGYFQSRISGRP